MNKFDKLFEEANKNIIESFSHDFGKFKPETLKQAKKFRPIVEDALEDFWIAVAKKLPEIKTGDMSSFNSIKTEDFMTNMVMRWYDDNSGE